MNRLSSAFALRLFSPLLAYPGQAQFRLNDMYWTLKLETALCDGKMNSYSNIAVYLCTELAKYRSKFA